MLRRTLDEELYRLAGADDLHGIGFAWRVHGGNPVDTLAVDAERLAAGGQQHDVRAASEQSVRELGAGADHVLAVVQQHKQAPPADGVDERIQGGAARLTAYAEHVRDGHRDEIRILKRGEAGEPHSVARAIHQPSGEL